MSEKFDINGIKGMLHYKSNKFIVCCHGLFSNKDSKKYIEMAKISNELNISCIRFDFRGCGESKGDFEESTLSNRLEDLIHVIEHFRDIYRNAKFSLFGSSFGGMVSILYASKYKVPIAIISTPHSIDMKINEKFLNDLTKYDILEACKNCSHILIIHGMNDELVPPQQALDIYKNAAPPKKILFYNADHSFTDDKIRKKALEMAADWLKNI